MSDLKPPFAFGQIVYVAYATPYSQTTVPCPICFGNKEVRLELGNGEMVPFECDMCGNGWGHATGVVTKSAPFSKVNSGQVSGMELRSEGWVINVGLESHRLSDRNVFATQEEAEARRAVLHAEAEKQAQRNFEQQFKSNLKGGWKVTYHKREIADCERKIAWHKARLASK